MKRLLLIVLACMSLSVWADNKKIALLEPRIGDGSTEVTGIEKAMIRGELRKAIVNHTGYEAFTRSDIDQMMKEQDFQRTGNVSDGDIHRLGEMSGADYICVATITKSDSEFYIEAFLINIETGAISNPASQYGELINGKLGNMLPVCQALAQELLGTLSPMVTTISTPAITPTVTPTITPTVTPATTTPATTTYQSYDVYRTFGDGFVVCGNQKTNYEDNALALGTLTDAIKGWEQVRTGAITETGDGLVIYGSNGYQFQGCGSCTGIKDKVGNYNNERKRIADVAINKYGHYVIIYEKNGYGSNGLPSKFLDALSERNEDGDKILSVSLDDGDNWAYVTEKYFRASNQGDHDFMKEATDKFGMIKSVCITMKGIVVCCAKGIYFKGVPKGVVDRILDMCNDGYYPQVVKFTDSGTCLITDGDRHYQYYM